MSTTVRMGKTKPRGGPHTNKPNSNVAGKAPIGFKAPTGKVRYASDPTPANTGPKVGYIWGKHE